jgi:hypothetical protein
MKIPNFETYDKDKRKPIKELYDSFLSLKDKGFIIKKICNSSFICDGKKIKLPIISLRTKRKGPAVYIISGIHGEEPAGPNAISKGIDFIYELSKEVSVVLIPLCNPTGYLRNWRYLDQAKYSKKSSGISVGDSEYLLLDIKNPLKARRPKPVSRESEALTKHILKLSKRYPPLMTFDLHEDDLIDEGYVFSHGELSFDEPIAKKIIKLLRKNRIPIKKKRETRFQEKVINGIIGSVKDGSIDELLSTDEIIVNKKIITKSFAKVAIVVETPSTKMNLNKRINAHLRVIKYIKNFID